MSILKTSKLGHPILRRVAEEVAPSELALPTTQKLIDDMIETMHEYDGVGIAAPQVHVPKQIAVIQAHKNPRYPWAPNLPLLVLVNPSYLFRAEAEQHGWEGCLSVEGIRAVVPRSEEVEIRYLDRDGHPEQLRTGGFLAVVIQHELDHLAGHVFLDRVKDYTTLTHLKEYERFWAKRPQEPPA